mgnify:CR=1 FL=1
MKIHEERDELLVKVEQLNAEKRELERQLDEVRLGGTGLGATGQRDGSGSRLGSGSGADADGLRDTIALLRKEQEVLRQEYEAELE